MKEINVLWNNKVEDSITWESIYDEKFIEHELNSVHFKSSEEHLTDLASRLFEEGQKMPIIVNLINGKILGGHTRVRALKFNVENGASNQDKVKVLWVKCLSDEEEMFYFNQDNLGSERPDSDIPKYLRVAVMKDKLTKMKSEKKLYKGKTIKNVNQLVAVECGTTIKEVEKQYASYKKVIDEL